MRIPLPLSAGIRPAKWYSMVIFMWVCHDGVYTRVVGVGIACMVDPILTLIVVSLFWAADKTGGISQTNFCYNIGRF